MHAPVGNSETWHGAGWSARTFRTALRAGGALLLVAVLSAACSAGMTSGAASPTPTQGSSPSAPQTYASRSFVVPFQIAVPDWLPAEPDQDRATFVTWERPEHPAVRIMVPVVVYPGGAAKPTAPAQDYLGYLLGLTERGARFDDQAAITVGGRPGTIVTGTTSRSLDGSLGCPEKGQSAADCFGLQPDLSLRLAVVPLDDRVLLAWLRIPVSADPVDTKAKIASFEQMLASVRFTGAGPTTSGSAAPAAATPLDGTWSVTTTLEELKNSPLLYDQDEINDDNWGTLTMKLSRGNGTSRMVNARKKGSTGTFGYTVDGDVVTMVVGNEKFVMRWTIQGDRLRFTRDESLGVAPTPFLIKPFIRRR